MRLQQGVIPLGPEQLAEAGTSLQDRMSRWPAESAPRCSNRVFANDRRKDAKREARNAEDMRAGENRQRMRKSHFISQIRLCENHTRLGECASVSGSRLCACARPHTGHRSSTLLRWLVVQVITDAARCCASCILPSNRQMARPGGSLQLPCQRSPCRSN